MSERLPPPAGKDRPFPWHCTECKAKEIYPKGTDYSIDVKHDDHVYTIRIPDLAIPTCRKCGNRVFSLVEDDRITAALRDRVGLLSPEEIQQRRRQLNLSPEQLAAKLGIARDALDHWEIGAMIQSLAMDNLLRLYFELQEARTILERRRQPVSVS